MVGERDQLHSIFSHGWQEARRPLRLPSAEVHVWRANLQTSKASLEELLQSLSAEERVRAARFVRETTAARFVATRGTLRRILGLYLDASPKSLVFRYGAAGKPVLEDLRGACELNFNLSHSGDFALFAFAREREVGVDMELMRTGLRFAEIARRFFTAAEFHALMSLSPAIRREAFVRAWTQKEAYVKAVGGKVLSMLDGFDVRIPLDVPPGLLAHHQRPEEVNRWTFTDVRPGAAYQATLAVEGSDWRLRRWNWPGE